MILFVDREYLKIKKAQLMKNSHFITRGYFYKLGGMVDGGGVDISYKGFL